MKKNFIMLILGLLISLFLNYFAYDTNDLIWNYGFCYNVSRGMIMYKDFNMVITPLYPFLFGNLMKLFGSNIIIFSILNGLLSFLLLLLVYIKKKNIYIILWILIMYVMIPNYNIMCIFLFFLIYIMEEENKSDYLIGLLLGLIFFTKTSFILLVLPSFYYYKDFKKIVKRVIGFCLVVLFFMIYFYITNSFSYFFNYVFLGLFDFGSNNFNFTIGVVISILVVIYLIYRYVKIHDIKILYVLFFQIMSYPLFNFSHVFYSLIIFIFYILDSYKININKYLKVVLFPLLFMPVLGLLFQFLKYNFVWGENRLENKLIHSYYVNNAKYLESFIYDKEHIVLVVLEAYYYKYLLDIDINKYDLLLYGNNGYDSINKIKNDFDNMDKGTIFVIDNEYPGNQLIRELYDYVCDNYKFRFSSSSLSIYVKE